MLQICEQSLSSSSLNADGRSDNMGGPESIKNSWARVWCRSLIPKSYFCLGKLEEALGFLDKLEQTGFATEKYNLLCYFLFFTLSVVYE